MGRKNKKDLLEQPGVEVSPPVLKTYDFVVVQKEINYKGKKHELGSVVKVPLGEPFWFARLRDADVVDAAHYTKKELKELIKEKAEAIYPKKQKEKEPSKKEDKEGESQDDSDGEGKKEEQKEPQDGLGEAPEKEDEQSLEQAQEAEKK